MEELVKEELVKYVEENIMKFYDLNGEAHGREHVKYVLNRANEISKNYCGINYDILYIVVIYHDIGDHIDRKNHEKVSAKMMMEDTYLDSFFTKDEKNLIKEAIEDHRSSKGMIPRSLYGKILASADKNIDVDMYFKRALLYNFEHYPNSTKQQLLDMCYEHAINKFGKNGYAVDMYFVNDGKYGEYIEKLQYLIDNKELFYEKANKIYDSLKMIKRG